jgi:hypothetical protein
MRKLLTVLFAFTVIFAGTSTAWSEEKKAETPADRPGGVIVESSTITAAVQEIDKANRMVTLKMSDGTLKPVKLSDQVKNFDQIEVGDNVVAEYIASFAVDVQKGGTGPGASTSSAIQAAPKGAKPGVVAIDTTTVVAVVEDIDYTKRTITIRTTEGTETIPVNEEVKRFSEIKKGDNVTVTETEALAISVKKP